VRGASRVNTDSVPKVLQIGAGPSILELNRLEDTVTRNEKIEELLAGDKDLVKQLVKEAIQEVLEAEMDQALQASRSERTSSRLGYRSGYYRRSLVCRVGKLELRVPQDRDGRFSTEVFDRYQRSEQALVLSMMQMYVQGVSTRRVKKITEELCGHRFERSTVSRLCKRLDAKLKQFAERRLDEQYPYLILDARYERVREAGVVRRRAVLVAIGISTEGRRCVLGVELANRESEGTWSDFISSLKKRGLRGVEFVVSDAHEGLQNAIMRSLPSAVWQRCYVHFLRNALDHMPRKADPDCRVELRWVYDRRTVEEARADLEVWMKKWAARYPKLCEWVDENIDETFTYFRLPRGHHKHMRSTNLLERVNEEIKRRTHIVRSFPNAQACLRLVRALTAEIHEEWQEGNRYLNMTLLEEQRKLDLKAA